MDVANIAHIFRKSMVSYHHNIGMTIVAPAFMVKNRTNSTALISRCTSNPKVMASAYRDVGTRKSKKTSCAK